MIHKIFNSSIFNSWFSSVVILFSSLVAIPIVITKLSVEEINVWFIFSSVVALSQGVLFGFSGTFSRFIAYSNSGVKIQEFRNLRFKRSSSYGDKNKDELARIFFLMKKVYVFLSAIYALIIFGAGYFVLQKPIEAMATPTDGWIAGIIVAVSTLTTLILGYYQVFLEGINKVALVQRVRGVVNLIGLVFILAVLFVKPTLISIILIYQIVAVCYSFTIIYFAKKELVGLKRHKRINQFDKELFFVVWESAWKSGITTIIANIVKHISVVLVAQFFTPAVSASFLFTKKIFDAIENFTMTTFQSRIPMIAAFRGRGDFKALMPYLRLTQQISYGVFLIGYTTVLFFGEDILSLINSNVEMGSIKLVVLFSFATFLSRWGGMTLSVSNQSNNVVEHINALIVGAVFFTIIFSFYKTMGIYIFPFAHIISLIIVIPLNAKLVYPSINTTFFGHEKKVMLPMLGILIIINLVFFILLK